MKYTKTNLIPYMTNISKSIYLNLFVSKFFNAAARSLIDIYGAALLYQNGFSIAQIFSIYGFRFGFMGLCTPISLYVSNTIGVAWTTFCANIMNILLAFVILYGIFNHTILLVILLALPGALANPLNAIFSTHYVESSHRGKYNSFRTIFKICGTGFSSLIVLYCMGKNQINLLFIYVAVCFFY